MRSPSLVTVGVLAGALALAPIRARAADDAPPDPWITTKAKISVLTAVGTSGTDVDVDTVDGRVTLHGTVASRADKDAAEKAARKVDGVKEVRNLLQVVPPAKAKVVATRDAEIRKTVEAALREDSELRGSEVEVESVNEGTVLLGGKADSLADHLRAIQVAKGVKGVRRVASEVRSPDADADAEIFKDRGEAKAEETKEKVRGIAGAAKDAWVTSKVKAALLTGSKTAGSEVNVDTDGGVVTLFGTVPSEDAKRKAESEARNIDGVTSVKNELQVVSATRERAVDSRDEDIAERIESKLDEEPALQSADIDVEVANGVARLSGTVDTEKERLKAKTLAREVEGVKSIQDDVKLKSGAAASLGVHLGDDDSDR
ncbi:MAG: hyperosmotically inducible periplasmic protein [Candidatus Binatota bacterium]|jgi:hyperosmotically inducible protein|nr:hyperosmotically inducible periplasmic protein [Candidatus Binatota bacterium]